MAQARKQNRKQGRNRRRRGSKDSRPSKRIDQYFSRNTRKAKPSKASQIYVNSLPFVDVEYLPPLLTRYPRMIGRLPWVSLRGCQEPFPPRRLLRSQHLFGDNYVFMKIENRDSYVMPDNKARKLEFLLGESLQKKKRKLVSFGFVGSSHCLAVAKAAKVLGLKSELVLLRCPLTETGVWKTMAMRNLGAKLRFRSTWNGMVVTAAWKWLCSKIFRTQLLPPGGSTSLGSLGYISAILELRQQVDRGELPAPDMLFIPAGSGGTLVGMEVGKRLFGFEKMKIIGVPTSDPRGVERKRLADMANGAIELLRSYMDQPVNFHFKESDFNLLEGYDFGGHGVAPEQLQLWIHRFLDLEGIDIEPVYSAKALYAMSDYLASQKINGKTVLFWNTYSEYRRGDLPQDSSLDCLPAKLKTWMKQQKQELAFLS